MYRVLVIEDEVLISDALAEVLTLSGYQVETACSGLEGLQRFQKGAFDVVITDISMPDMDGRAVANRIRCSNRPDTPIIGMSGTPQLLGNAQFNSVFHKPFSLNSLLEAIGKLTVRH
jgi:two-component system response regulator VanR